MSDLFSAENVFKLLHKFQKCSSPEVNLSKTEGMWLGTNRHNKTKHFGIAWPSNSDLLLGVHFSKLMIMSDSLFSEKNEFQVSSLFISI